MEKRKVSTSGEPVKVKLQVSFGIPAVAFRIAGNALPYGRSLFFSDLDLASVLSEARSETNVAISIITNTNMAVSQMEPANMSSRGRLW